MDNRLFVKADILCKSPLAVGSGRSDFTDKDVLLDANGRPFIPGATVAGVCRHYLGETAEVKSLFGDVTRSASTDSRILFYDASLEGDFVQSFRDGVRIGSGGTAEDGGKFDFEVVDFKDRKSCFKLRIEVTDCSDTDRELVIRMLSGMIAGEIRLGHKTSRGYGLVGLQNISSFTAKTVDDLLAFSWSGSKFEPLSVEKANSREIFSQQFDVSSFVTVSFNATEIKKQDEDKYINSEALKNAANKPVVPGTSIAGVFRHHFQRIIVESGCKTADEAEKWLDGLFGSTEQAAKIIFDEAVVNGSKCMLQTRNAIDRFTGGACYKKLFTNQLAFGGQLTVTVMLKNGLKKEDEKLAVNLIELTMSDLADGTVNLGGLGSVGGGILKKAEAL
ncbi:MAG: hypothetical protein K5647_05170 [Clostridiales bacterium]|nr:hypothetical protein [Clostridiales bacterium]